MTEEQSFTLEKASRDFARKSNHACWDLLAKDELTDSEKIDLLAAAYTSFYHWRQVGGPAQAQRAYWMLATAHIRLRETETALRYAELCLAEARLSPDEMQDFDWAYAYEVNARAHALAEYADSCREFYSNAADAGEQIREKEDRDLFLNDLKSGEWFGFQP